jgi:hypothetical protein
MGVLVVIYWIPTYYTHYNLMLIIAFRSQKILPTLILIFGIAFFEAR